MNGLGRLDIKQLRIFNALLKEKNLSRVAKQIGLTQQAVSEHLRKLRGVFNDQLFVRSSQGMIPTPVAQRLGVKVAHILDELEDLFEQPEFDPASLDCIYTICATDYAQSVILPPLLAVIHHQAPKLKIIVRTFEIDNLDNLMSSGDVDLAFTFPEFIPAHYHYQRLFQEHHICVARKGFALAGNQLTIAEVAALPQLIVSPSRANLRGSHDDWFNKRAGKRNIVMSVPFFSAAADCVKNTNMIAFLPSRLLPNEQLIQLSLDETPPGFDVIAAWHSRSNHDPMLNWILNLLATIFKSPDA